MNTFIIINLNIMNNDLMDQFAGAYQSDFTQKQEPSKMNNSKKYFGSFNPLSSRSDDLEGSVNMSTQESIPVATQQKSGGGLMSLF